MSRISAQAFRDFDALGGLFARTRAALDAVMGDGRPSRAAVDVLATETLPHLEIVEAGFRACLRSSDGDAAELRNLVLHGGLAVPAPRDGPEARAALIEAMQAIKGAGGTPRLLAAPGRDLAAIEHARLAMSLLPLSPPAAVRFPGRPSYADIAPPRSPGELAARIEELERSIWRTATGRPDRPTHPRWRRVYAFFDAGERLALDGLLPS